MRAGPSVLLLLAAGILSGCAGTERGLRLILLTDLTGPHSPTGQGIRMAAELALTEHQSALSDAGWRVELAAFDACGSSPDLPGAISRIASQPDVFCAVVHTTAEGNISAAQILHAAGIPTVLPLDTSPLPAGERFPETAWLSPDDPTHGAAAAEWAAAAGFTDVFLLTDSSRHAQAVGEGFLQRAGDLGLSVSASLLPVEINSTAWIPSFNTASADLVVFSGSSGFAGSILGSLESLAYSGSFFFAESEGEDRLPKDFSSGTVRIFFSPAAEHSEDFLRAGRFADAFRDAYGTDPPDLAGPGYEAAAICLQSLLHAGGSDPASPSPRAGILAEWQTDVVFHGMTGDYSPARGRPCRISIFARPADSESAWEPVFPDPAAGGTDSVCGWTAAAGG
jgi:ABC-type branched-subunit amino acid transport system substrate-binding protein